MEPVMVTMTFELGGDSDMDAMMEQSLESQIQRNPHRRIDVVTTKYDGPLDSKCAICQDSYELEEDVSTLPCEHLFHAACIKEWGKHKPECPVCRAAIPC
jgi:hypothetical protein